MTDISALAARIAAALFTATVHQEIRADRLKLYRDGQYLAGWSEKPAADLIEKVLREENADCQIQDKR